MANRTAVRFEAEARTWWRRTVACSRSEKEPDFLLISLRTDFTFDPLRSPISVMPNWSMKGNEDIWIDEPAPRRQDIPD